MAGGNGVAGPTSFEDLEAWKVAREIVASIYALCKRQGIRSDFGLRDQLQRAAVSIMTNVAEGFERMHPAEKLQFYNLARGSSAEVRSLLYVVEDNYPNLLQHALALRGDITRAGRLLTGLIRSTQHRTKS